MTGQFRNRAEIVTHCHPQMTRFGLLEKTENRVARVARVDYLPMLTEILPILTPIATLATLATLIPILPLCPFPNSSFSSKTSRAYQGDREKGGKGGKGGKLPILTKRREMGLIQNLAGSSGPSGSRQPAKQTSVQNPVPESPTDPPVDPPADHPADPPTPRATFRPGRLPRVSGLPHCVSPCYLKPELWHASDPDQYGRRSVVCSACGKWIGFRFDESPKGRLRP